MAINNSSAQEQCALLLLLLPAALCVCEWERGGGGVEVVLLLPAVAFTYGQKINWLENHGLFDFEPSTFIVLLLVLALIP